MSITQQGNWQCSVQELLSFALFYAVGFILLNYYRKGKEPVKLRSLKVVYNALMSAFSLYVFVGVTHLLLVNYSRSTAAINPFLCDSSLELFNGMEWYFQVFYWSKYVEYIDTIFLVLAGMTANGPSLKMSLHVYHHLITPSICYITWFYPCMGGWFGPITNAFVHTIMYAYYGLSVVYPGVKKYANLVTYVQLVQFIVVITYLSVAIAMKLVFGCGGECNMYQMWFNYSQYVIFFVLFFMFLSKKNKSVGKGASNGSVVQNSNGVMGNGKKVE